MRGGAEVAGHLHGELGAARQRGEPAGQQLPVLRHPVQHGVGEHDVGVRGGRPADDVDASRVDPGGAGGGDHLRGAVEALDHGRGQRAASSAVRFPGRSPGRRRAAGSVRDPGQQVVEGPGAVVGEGEVGRRVPGCSVLATPPSASGDVGDDLGDDVPVRPGVRPHLQHRAVPAGHLALDEPGSAAGQVAVVAAADRALDAGVHGLRDAARVDQAEPARGPVGQQHGARPVVRGELLLGRLDHGQRAVLPDRADDEVPADPAGTAGLGQPEAPRRHHEVRPVGGGRDREHPLVRFQPAGEPLGQPVAEQAAQRRAQTSRSGVHVTAPIAFSRSAIRYCSSGTRSPNSSR